MITVLTPPRGVGRKGEERGEGMMERGERLGKETAKKDT